MQKNKISLFKTIKNYFLVMFVLFTFVFLLVGYITAYNEYKVNSQNLRATHVQNVKDTLTWEVEHYIEFIRHSKESFEKKKKAMLKNRVNHEYILVSNLFEKYKNKKSLEEIKEIIIATMRNIKFSDGGYYFIMDINGTMIFNDDQRLDEGTNLLESDSLEKVNIVKSSIEFIKKNKEGVHSYKWKKDDGSNKEIKKTSYIKLFEPFSWVIGTGFFEDDVRKNIQEEILTNIEQLKFDPNNNNYIFIGQWDGIVLNYPAKGKNMYNIQDKNGLYIVQELVKKAKEGGGFVQYEMPSLEDERNSQKISYVQGIPEWQWYVGAGLYVDDINKDIAGQKEKMFDEFLKVSIATLLLALVAIIIFFIFLNEINKKIKKDFLLFIDFFNSLVKNDKEIDIKSIKFKEFEEMALHANNMLNDKIKLEDHLEKYKTIVSASGDFLALIDKNYVYHAINDTYLEYCEKTREKVVGYCAKEIFGKEDFEKNIKPYYDRALKGETFTSERWVNFSRKKRFLHAQYFPHKAAEKNEIEYIVISARDITEKKCVEDKLRLWEKVFENTSEAVMVCSPSLKIVAVNSAFTTITGYSKEEAIGKNSAFMIYDVHNMINVEEVISCLHKDGHWSGEVKNRRANGEVYHSLLSANTILDENGKHVNHVSIFSDITKLKESEKKLEFLAHHDVLTHLPNRVLLKDRILHATDNAKREKTMVAICFIDLDNFKKINDSYGHAYGDDVLKQTAQRVGKSLRSTDTLSRIGGDEFILVLEHLKKIDEVEETIKKVQMNFIEPFISHNQKFFITASIGVSMYPNDGVSVETLMKNSDVAMYKAKDSGRNTYRFYSHEMSTASYDLVDMENSLIEAVKKEQFLVFYQPQINLKTKEVIGAEALIRWNHPKKGILSPIEFIKISEDTKMIIPMGEFILRQACMDIQHLKNNNQFDGKISINVSGIQIEHSDFLSTLKKVIQETKIEAKNIELEITESVIMNDPQQWIDLLNSIQKMGVKIAIDDFGTGYSSLSYLRKLPIDKLKIDMSFVRDIPGHEDACSIVNSIITLSDNMKMTTLAEGIETKEQEDYLRENNCEEGQGYLYAKPMDFKSFQIWLAKR